MIGSNIPDFSDFDSFDKARIGFFNIEILPYRRWATLEHIAFWTGITLIVFPFLVKGPAVFEKNKNDNRSDQNKKIILQIITEGINGSNFSLFEDLIHSNFVNHSNPENSGMVGFKEGLLQFINSFPDIHLHIEELISNEDFVATRGYWTGTHKRAFMNIPPTKKKVKVEYMDFWKVSNGKCTDKWMEMDMDNLLFQLRSIS
jgi:predicted ester cyclase